MTRIAPGSRMASGGSSVRSAPSTIPAEAAVNTRQATTKAATLGSRVASARLRAPSRARPSTITEPTAVNATFTAPGCRISPIPTEAITQASADSQAG